MIGCVCLCASYSKSFRSERLLHLFLPQVCGGWFWLQVEAHFSADCCVDTLNVEKLWVLLYLTDCFFFFFPGRIFVSQSWGSTLIFLVAVATASAVTGVAEVMESFVLQDKWTLLKWGVSKCFNTDSHWAVSDVSGWAGTQDGRFHEPVYDCRYECWMMSLTESEVTAAMTCFRTNS